MTPLRWLILVKSSLHVLCWWWFRSGIKPFGKQALILRRYLTYAKSTCPADSYACDRARDPGVEYSASSPAQSGAAAITGAHWQATLPFDIGFCADASADAGDSEYAEAGFSCSWRYWWSESAPGSARRCAPYGG